MIGKPPFSGQKCRSALCSFLHGSSSPAGASCAPHTGVHLGRRSRSPGRSWCSAPPAQLRAPARLWALVEEGALPEGVAVWPLSSCCRKGSSIAPPGFFFLFTYLSHCRGDPVPQDGPCLPTGHCPCEQLAELLCGSRFVVSLQLQAHVLVAVCAGTAATHSLWSPPWVRGLVAVCTGTTATHSDVTSPGDEMLISLGAIRSQAAASRGASPWPCLAPLPCPRALSCPAAAAPDSGGQLLHAPLPYAFPQLLGQMSSCPASEWRAGEVGPCSGLERG